MKFRTLFTIAMLAAGVATAAQALERQPYGQDVDAWQAERDQAFRQRGPAGLVEFDRETARRFYGNKFPNTRDLDVQIRIDRGETQLDTQERADQIRYGFGRAAAQAGVAPVVRPEFQLRPGDSRLSAGVTIVVMPSLNIGASDFHPCAAPWRPRPSLPRLA